MAKPLKVDVKESIAELRLLQRKHGEFIGKRLQMVIEIKKSKDKPLSKRELSRITGINHNSIVKWRKMYNEGGIDALLTHNRKGFKPSQINEIEHKQIEEKLNNPVNGLQGYKELLEWVNSSFNKEMKYTTLYEYVKRHFKTKIKVARKSHIKKDKEAETLFKKTSVKKFKK